MIAEDIEIKASIIHPDLGRDPVPGIVRFKQSAMRFESEAFKIELPIIDLLLELPPHGSDGDVKFRHPRMSGCEVRADGDVLEHPVFARCTNLRQQAMNVYQGREVRRRLVVCAWALGVFAVLTLVGWVASKLAVGFVVRKIPVSYEEKLGEEAFVEAGKFFSVDSKATNELARLNGIKDRLVGALPKDEYNIRVHVLDTALPNAFALPGGRMVFTKGLLGLMKSDDEVAAVMAHELAHIRHRHSLRQIVSAGGPALLMRVITRDSEGALGAISVGFEFLLNQRFSRDHERDADETGFGYMMAAGMNPHAMEDMLAKLQSEEARLGASPGATQPMSSHPATAERIQRVRVLWEKLPDKERFSNSTTNRESGK